MVLALGILTLCGVRPMPSCGCINVWHDMLREKHRLWQVAIPLVLRAF